jgi:N-acetylglucosamine-6-phosphate deacetylase
MATVLRNARILAGDEFRDDVAVVIEDGRIAAAAGRGPQLAGPPSATWAAAGCCPASSTCRSTAAAARCSTTRRTWRLRTIARRTAASAPPAMLPTLISDDVAVMAKAIGRRARGHRAGRAGRDRHPSGRAVHRARAQGHARCHKFRVPDATRSRWPSLDNGVTLLTLAPERAAGDHPRAGRARRDRLRRAHRGTYEEIRAGLDAGVRGFTHLYNAMSPLQGREPGAVGAALEDRDSWIGIIVDGVHVHPASLRVALAAKPRGRCCW